MVNQPFKHRNPRQSETMVISINNISGENHEEGEAGLSTGGSSGFRLPDDFREALDEVLKLVSAMSDFNQACTSLNASARGLVKLGMPVSLMFEYQDKLAAIYKHRQEPVAPVTYVKHQTIDQMNHITNSSGPLKGGITTQNVGLAPTPNDKPQLLE